MLYQENELYFDLSADLHLIKCGKRLNAVNHSFGPVIRRNYWLIFIREGNGVLHSSEKYFPLQSGQCFCTFPEREFSYQFTGNTEIYWISFDTGFSEQILDTLGLSSELPVITVSDPAEVLSVFRQLDALSSSPSQRDSYYILSSVYRLLGLLTDPQREIRVRSDRYVDYALRYMEHNYSEEMQVSDIARALHLESTYFSKQFKQVTGLCPSEYLTRLRIRKACLLLRDTALSVQAVAASVGIRDAFYFSRKFRLAVGVSPREFRSDPDLTFSPKDDTIQKI